MENTAIQAIQSVLSAQKSFCKFLSANDTGLTGGHQAGIYISKPAVPILFDEPGVKGENKELVIVPGASHCDLYDGGGKGAIPFDRIETFYRKYLK